MVHSYAHPRGTVTSPWQCPEGHHISLPHSPGTSASSSYLIGKKSQTGIDERELTFGGGQGVSDKNLQGQAVT